MGLILDIPQAPIAAPNSPNSLHLDNPINGQKLCCFFLHFGKGEVRLKQRQWEVTSSTFLKGG